MSSDRREPVFEEPRDGTERANIVVEEMGGLPEDNAFADVAREMRDEGESWGDVFSTLNEVFRVVDKASAEEMNELIPDWRVTIVVPDAQSTSGERYEQREWTAETADKAEEEVEERTGYRAVPEKTEQIGVSKVF